MVSISIIELCVIYFTLGFVFGALIAVLLKATIK